MRELLKVLRFYSVVYTLIFSIAGAAYFIIAPKQHVTLYAAKVSAGAENLRRDLIELQKTVEDEVFNNPDRNASENLTQLLSIKSEINTVETKLAKYRNDASSYSIAPYTALSPEYAEANAIAEDVRYMTSQSEQVIHDYKKLTEFLSATAAFEQTVESRLNSINTITDFNAFAGQHQVMYDWADEVRAAKREYEKVPPPEEYDELKQVLLQRADELAAGLEQIGYGLFVAIDNELYGGTAMVEQVSADYYGKDRILRFELSQLSPTLKNVSELTDKLEILED